MNSFFSHAFSGEQILFSVFLLIGLLELLILYIVYRRRKNILDNGRETGGRVTEIISGSGSKGGTIYYPVFQFKTHYSEVITQKSRMGSNPAPYKAGDELTIVYNPEKPQQFVIRGDKSYRILYMLIGFLAVVFIAVGLFGTLPFLQRFF